jgi:hypothetical protein
MSQKAHGTSERPVQKKLRWNCDFDTADRICNFSTYLQREFCQPISPMGLITDIFLSFFFNLDRHYAEYAGYWQTTDFLKAVKEMNESDLPIKFYDSVTGALLFEAPKGRSMEEFLKESASHGWPSFRDEEVNWEYVRCLKDGECVSTTGTHLGHNLPDKSGNRYCINLVSVAGEPEE